MANVHNIPIRIANILIELSSAFSATELGIEECLGAFCAVPAPEEPLARVVLRWKESSWLRPPARRVNLRPRFRLENVPCGTGLLRGAGLPRRRPGGAARGVLLANPGWNDLTLTEQRTGPRWQSLLSGGAGELILRTAVLFSGGLVFHSSGLDDNGRGIVFIGHSGAGKSTQAGLWSREPGVIVMNDDRIAVRAETRGPMCYGTPWGGAADIARAHQAPLAALIVLEQAPENGIQRLSPSASAALLLARAFLPYWDRALMQRAMANLNAILARASLSPPLPPGA